MYQQQNEIIKWKEIYKSVKKEDNVEPWLKIRLQESIVNGVQLVKKQKIVTKATSYSTI